MRRRLLAAAGFVNLVFAAFQLTLAFAGAAASRYLGAPRWALAVLERGGPALWLIVAAAAGLSAVVGLYGLSGAGLIRRLPALGPVLVVAGSGYVLWSLRVVQFAVWEWQSPGSVAPRWFVIRGAPLLLGLAYLLGASAVAAAAPRVKAARAGR